MVRLALDLRLLSLAVPLFSPSTLFLCAWRLSAIALLVAAPASARAQAREPFVFDRDTFAFINDTVFAYEDGHPSLRHESSERYTARCFVMSRAVVQFRKFARFDPKLPPLPDAALAKQVRAVTGRAVWREPLRDRARIVIPGAANLRTLSRTRPRVVQANIGLGTPTYFRPGNWRVLLPHLPGQSARVKATLDQTLGRGELFIAYLTALPNSLSINHAVLVFKARSEPGGNVSYTVYDPNYTDAPKKLQWLSQTKSFFYPPNSTFVGGPVNVWQVYAYPIQ